MTISLSKPSPKRAISITLSMDVYNEARALGINLSQTCDRLLREAIAMEKARCRPNEHAEFIAAYNQMIEQEGLPLDQWRTF